MRKNGGFSSVYTAMILASLTAFLLVIAEVCAGFATGSICENICVIAGQSTLSEYQRSLQERYGIFALRGTEEELEEICAYYIVSNAESSGGIVKPRLKECAVSTEESVGLNYEVFADQVEKLGGLLVGKALIEGSSLSSLLAGIRSIVEVSSGGEDVIGELENLREAPEPVYDEEGIEIPEDPNSVERREQAGSLLCDYREASEQEDEVFEGGSLASIDISNLPSSLLGVSETYSLLLSGGIGELSPGSIAQSVYIIQVCGNYVNKSCEILDLECEYILFGATSDRENLRKTSLSLFALRSAINLAEIYADSAQMAEISGLAASFPAVPLPLATFIIAATRAALAARGDLARLKSGETVPLLSTRLMEASGIGFSELVNSFGDYGDYLFLLMLMLPEEARMVRLMDIMQLNIALGKGESFSFRDYCYGFKLQVQFEKVVHLSESFGLDRRYGYFEQKHIYR
ncbi:MAG: hypothetical protein GX975_03195 [Clostridiales bacterium]|nr:hypothetical protein [Clostridiales bacterium]